MKETSVLPIVKYGYDFINPQHLGADRDEYRLRNRQIDGAKRLWRRLKAAEIEVLVKNDNTCANWDDFLVSDPFDPALIKNSNFAGLVRLGKLAPVVLRHHDFEVPAGIRNSTIIACDFGDDCAVQDCSYISHYIVGDAVILYNVDEMQATDHAKFGNGVIKDGESEDVRIWIDVMNEAGGRSILPFDGMICADAYLWAAYRDDLLLMEKLKSITQTTFGGERGAYGVVGSYSIIKSTGIIKDVAIGECAYIKGANKLKNLTVNSSEAEPTQIGEGVELVNGIIDYGCRIFYGCKAVRFAMGRNSSLKYGARLIHSVLGDNSTVSCCEILNNLIFPAHEQHHNNSFLIASLVQGLSNLAAGATIGSNHNSRAPDGEIRAGRGFWPGLCVTLKHSCRFAAYTLIAKGDYPAELNITLPFALLNNNVHLDRLEVMPAYFWMHNMYALERNSWKTAARDKRAVKVQRIESEYLAPDTVEEILKAMEDIAYWTGVAKLRTQNRTPTAVERGAVIDFGLRLLTAPSEAMAELEVRAEGLENDRRPTVILKARQAWHAYRDMLRWYGVRTVMAYLESRGGAGFATVAAELSSGGERETRWVNLGGQIVNETRLDALRADIREGRTATWTGIHAAYDAIAAVYPDDRARHAWSVLRLVVDADRRYPELSTVAVSTAAAVPSGNAAPPTFNPSVTTSAAAPAMDAAVFAAQLDTALELRRWIGDQVYQSRAKDYRDPFRAATYRNREEMDAVLGTVADNSFIKAARQETANFEARVGKIKSMPQ